MVQYLWLFKGGIILGYILGNLCSLLAMLCDSYSSTKENKRDLLFTQSISQFIYGLSSIFLKGYSASVQNFISIIRNYFALKEDRSKVIEWSLIIAGIVLGVIFNNRGLIGWLPILANLEYSLAVFYIKDNERLIKISFLITVIMYTMFNIFILNIVGTITNSIVIISYTMNLLKNK